MSRKRPDVIWFDSFRNEYCIPSERDLGIAPPERYLRTVRSPGDFYVEHWVCDDGSLMDIACPAYRYRDEDCGIWEERDYWSGKNDVTLSYISWWEIPPAVFDRYVIRFRLVCGQGRRQ